ncbi:hypothetical protein LTR49_027305 [Elasticomyces elasticus]|nr:hypothetical protein LTR49_027305 [Elasticomyces elasticus]
MDPFERRAGTGTSSIDLETQSLGTPYQVLTNNDVFESQKLETRQLTLQIENLLRSQHWLPAAPDQKTKHKALNDESPSFKELQNSQGGVPLPSLKLDAIVR